MSDYDSENNKNKDSRPEWVLKAVAFIQGIYATAFDVVRPVLTQLFEILDEGQVSKRAAVWAGIALTIYCIHWCFGFATTPPPNFSGTDIAAIIAAILTPVAGLTGALMKYGESMTRPAPTKEDNNNG